MASLFLNPPPSSLSVFKKNPTSTTTFSRYPLLKNPNLSLCRFPKSKTNSRNLLKFSVNNNTNNEEEETKKTEFIFEKRGKVIAELEKFLENDLQKWDEIDWVSPLSRKPLVTTLKEWKELFDWLEARDEEVDELIAQRDKELDNLVEKLTEVDRELRKPLTEKEWKARLAAQDKELDELFALSDQRDKELNELIALSDSDQVHKELDNFLLEKLADRRESIKTRDESIEKLDMLIGRSAESEELEKSEPSSSSSKVPPLKEEVTVLEVLYECGMYELDPTIENLENVKRLCMNKKESGNPFFRLLDSNFLEVVKCQILWLEYIDSYSKRLNVNKMESCFEHDTFFITDIRKVRCRWTFTGFLKKPVEEVMPKLEKKLSKATGKDVIVCFSKHEYDMTKQVCTVEPKESMDSLLKCNNGQTQGNIPAIVLCIASFGMTTLMSSFLLKPNATFDDYLANVVPLSGGLFSILGISEIATRITAARYGVKLSPSYLIPSIWTGLLGVVNNYESLLPNNKALFDIPVARTASAYLMSLVLVITAFVVDGSFNGGDNPMYISPGFFSYNTLLFYIQSVIGPYRDDFGNILPYVVEGVGVPVNPLAFAGILGFAVTSINLLPFRRMEGGRITQALFGHFVAKLVDFFLKLFLLAIGVLDGNVLCLVWFLVSTYRDEDETPVKDEITPLGDVRYTLGFILEVICVLTLFPNIAGRFSVFHFFVEIYNVISSSLSYNS